MVDLDDLIHVYENALDFKTCDFLINVFDNASHLHESIENEGKPNFTQFNLTENKNITDELNKVHNHIIKQVHKHRDLYYEFVDSRVFPSEHSFEQFRIKRYNTGGEDRFDTHVDVADYSSARRFLSFMFYLNDVSEGGKTVFRDRKITPKTGSLLVFPPLWMYPHCGDPPISNPKYIMSTYLHYK
jgi:prolyl 4-hydroxylase